MSESDLKQNGLKSTLPRIKVLEILEAAAGEHLSAEDIYKAMFKQGHDIALATVYRVLTQFVSAGMVKRHNFDNDYAVFEINNGNHHDHMVCVKCGKIVEFIDQIIEKRQLQVAAEHGFEITDHSLHIYGVCGICNTNAL